MPCCILQLDILIQFEVSLLLEKHEDALKNLELNQKKFLRDY